MSQHKLKETNPLTSSPNEMEEKARLISGFYATDCQVTSGAFVEDGVKVVHRTGVAFLLATVYGKRISLAVRGLRLTSSPAGEFRRLAKPVEWLGKGEVSQHGSELNMAYEVNTDTALGITHDSFENIALNVPGIFFKGGFTHPSADDEPDVKGELVYTKFNTGEELACFLNGNLHPEYHLNIRSILKEGDVPSVGHMIARHVIATVPPKPEDEYITVDLITGRYVYSKEANMFDAINKRFGDDYAVLFGRRTDGLLSTIR
jgi:hypothetical protein